jgi:beta-1,4-mannooligosaccharide/beta-1,4-mannosyl-N-acetylglucosamine phosphorylase
MAAKDRKHLILGSALPNIPWEDRPAGCADVVWRSSRNPVIPRNAIPSSNSIFNSAVVPFRGAFAGVFRCDTKARQMQIHSGKSKDGINWEIAHNRIEFICDDPEVRQFQYAYDPRVCWLEDRYYVTWCNGYHGPTIGVGYTHDFEKFYQLENAFMPHNRNGVLFPRKIKGKYAMLSRPSDRGHTPFGDIFYSESPDMCHWGRHRFVMGTAGGWQSTKIGAGPTPIETEEGWLLIYHGVLTSCNGFVYSYGAALLDLDQPWKVLHRARPYLMSPQTLYECVGDVPNVAFPCAALTDAPAGRITLYYGGADTVTCMAHAHAQELIDFIKANRM